MSGSIYDVLYCSDTEDDEKYPKKVRWATPLEHFYEIPARETPQIYWHEEYDSDEFEWEFTRSNLAPPLCGGKRFVANQVQ